MHLAEFVGFVMKKDSNVFERKSSVSDPDPLWIPDPDVK
jgi:hypothetical protein